MAVTRGISARGGLSSRLKTLLLLGKHEEIRALLRGLSNTILIDELGKLPPRNGLTLCSMLPPDRLSEVVSALPRRDLQGLLAVATTAELRGLILSLPLKQVPEVFRSLSPKQARDLKKKLPKEIQKLLDADDAWPEDSVGAIMSNSYVLLSPQDTVASALKKVRVGAHDRESIYSCYVSDGYRFLGAVALEDLVLAAPETKVLDVTEDDCTVLTPEMDRADAARIMSRYDLQVLPVVKGGKLLGVLPFDDVLDVMEEENTELLFHAAGLYGSTERKGLFGEALRRFPCLLLCLVTGILTTGVMENYEALLSQVVALSFFVPLLIDTGGNVGGQISVLIIRSMGIGSLSESKLGRVLVREFLTALLLGGAMAVLAAARAWMLGTGFSVMFVVSLAMIAVVMAANMLGAVLPFIVKRVGLDPALISGPLLTTIVDVLGLVLYFAVARMIL